MKPSRSEFLDIRGLKYHVRHWGEPGAPKLFMLHGWMDVAASFQFVVDALPRDWHVIAPDWRGFGLTESNHSDTYWFPDYLGDLDAILDHYSAGIPANLIGHSMGGNIACIYAGARPTRVARLVNLEGFGLPGSRPDQAPERYAKWMDELRHIPKMRPYGSLEEVATRLQRNNPRLSTERAAFLAAHWASQNADGEWIILGDPAHKLSNPVLYRIEEVLACWRAIKADVLWVEAEDTDALRWMGPKESAREEIDRRIKALAKVSTAVLGEAGHMLHHDQPERLAELIESFIPR
ncbi:alpha/beta fold hydrolase [Noviherbaspirillum galbum]|uniref:Alpha/beta hydrolase n=1 Tax=Noviherbaspirillum galbum TaxID=2709383 RepID=A0A6B3SND2_9BURK|nr:alpha/beta hydrolase [Noviherbaspirillum galbum]NEX59922.1 alpha/beta hydrolase [Noviherbaspirillum galbum]